MIECDNDSSKILDNVIGALTLSSSLATLIILVEDTQTDYYCPKACRDCFACSQSREHLHMDHSNKYILEKKGNQCSTTHK